MFQKPTLFPSSGIEAPHLVDHLELFSVTGVEHLKGSLGTTEMINLLRYAPENVSGPR
jgi:hypothetical protein